MLSIKSVKINYSPHLIESTSSSPDQCTYTSDQEAGESPKKAKPPVPPGPIGRRETENGEKGHQEQ